MVRFLALESLLLGCLPSLAGYVFWRSGGTTVGLGMEWRDQLAALGSGLWENPPLVLIIAGFCCLTVVLYWLLQSLGMTTCSYWMVTLAALLPQGPAVLAHNQLDWASFWRASSTTPELSQITVGALFLLTLVLLVALQRVAELRRLRGGLRALRLESGEQGGVIASEMLALAALVGASLAVAATLLLAASALARMDYLLAHSPWTVLTIGAAALAMVTGFLHLWLRTRTRQGN